MRFIPHEITCGETPDDSRRTSYGLGKYIRLIHPVRIMGGWDVERVARYESQTMEKVHVRRSIARVTHPKYVKIAFPVCIMIPVGVRAESFPAPLPLPLPSRKSTRCESDSKNAIAPDLSGPKTMVRNQKSIRTQHADRAGCRSE